LAVSLPVLTKREIAMLQNSPNFEEKPLRILVLGGTAWLGRHMVKSALADGHEVTCLARGESGKIPSGARWIHGDRDHENAYANVQDERWDSVIDVSRQPGQVRRAAAALAGTCGSFVFVSSTSVYADHMELDQDESAPLLPALESDVMENMSFYGPAKVACEQHVRDLVGADRALIARVGLIGGPEDEFDRTGYWPLRFARAAAGRRAVLVPDTPSLPTQVIDVRDLAQWIVQCASRGVAGLFNVTGETKPFEEHIEVARRVAGHHGAVVAAPHEWLLRQAVAPWMGPKSLPLWLPMGSHAGFNARNSSQAVQAGLVRRPLHETLRDVLAWELSRSPLPAARRAGLSDAEEAELLLALEREVARG
jgi:2'-hydroxyisoflavone reductase